MEDLVNRLQTLLSNSLNDGPDIKVTISPKMGRHLIEQRTTLQILA